jgi:hypothetical protein
MKWNETVKANWKRASDRADTSSNIWLLPDARATV